MTIIVRQGYATRPYGPSGDTFPIGLWAKEVITIGDASGGVRSSRIVFNEATSPVRTSLLFSLEQYNFEDSDNVDKDCLVRSQGMDLEGGEWAIRVSLLATPSGIAVSNAHMSELPVFLGGQTIAGLAAELILETTNVNLAPLAFRAQGYLWDAKARGDVRGPQRPISIYPS